VSAAWLALMVNADGVEWWLRRPQSSLALAPCAPGPLSASVTP
jgi:hypothetical protein